MSRTLVIWYSLSTALGLKLTRRVSTSLSYREHQTSVLHHLLYHGRSKGNEIVAGDLLSESGHISGFRGGVSTARIRPTTQLASSGMNEQTSSDQQAVTMLRDADTRADPPATAQSLDPSDRSVKLHIPDEHHNIEDRAECTPKQKLEQCSVYDSVQLPDASSYIRVLDLDSAIASDVDAPILGTLRTVNLQDNPIYSALSYVWGQWSNPKDLIYCEQYQIPVTRNCLSALRHLRKIYGRLTIWIDAICINQSSESEKSSQVALMGQIYTSSRIVYIWLGEGTKASDRAMDFLATDILPLKKPWSTAFRMFYVRCRYNQAPLLVELQDLFGRAWITRLWTLQEILLSKEAAVICGTKQIPWAQFARSVALLEYLNARPPRLIMPDEFRSWAYLVSFWLDLGHSNLARRRTTILRSIGDLTVGKILYSDELPCIQQASKNVMRIITGILGSLLITVNLALLFAWVGPVALRRKVHPLALTELPCLIFYALSLPGIGFGILYFRAELSLAWAIQWSHKVPRREYTLRTSEAVALHIAKRESFFAVDKYFGVLGVLHRDISWQPAVEYGASIEVAYRALTVELLYRFQSLDVLLFMSWHRFPDSPSWVIDWRSPETSWIQWRHAQVQRIATRPAAYSEDAVDECFKGASTDYFSFTPMRDSNVIAVDGSIISDITWVSGAIEKLTPKSSRERELQNLSNFHTAIHAADPAHLPEQIRDLRLLCPEWGDNYANAHLEGQIWTNIMYESTQDTWKGPEWAYNKMKLPPWKRRARFSPWQMHMEITNTIAGVGQLVRCSGRHTGIGFASMSACEGDVVALVKGMSMPLILRRRGQNFTLVGPAFLGGVMNGEVWETLSTTEKHEILIE